MESTEIADSLREAQELDLDKKVAIYIALLAVLLSICSVGGGNATKDSTRLNIQASDTWAYYQAKNSGKPPTKLPPKGYSSRLWRTGSDRGEPQADRADYRRLRRGSRPA